jgi:tetratricopeptide (TPR) repeat protein
MSSASSTAEEKSTEARNRGNDLYRKGLFDEATKAYFEALSLTPNDSAPLSNLSAVQFELGNYSGSAIYAEKALSLLQDEADSNPKKQKLLSRLARAQILQLKDAAPLTSKLASSDTAHNSVAIKHGGRRESVTWTKVLDEIPRYRPML